MPEALGSFPPLGVLMLEHEITRPPGDVGNPASFPFPVRYRTVTGVPLDRLLAGDPTILEPLLEAGRELQAQGVWGITSGCGFFVLFQERLAARLEVPVFLSSLLQIPLAQAVVGPEAKVGVLTAHAGRLGQEHLLAAGMDPARPVEVVGLEDRPAFAGAILKQRGEYRGREIEAEVTAAARELARRPGMAALVLECTNLPPFALAIQRATGLPVFDLTTLVGHAFAARFRRPFPASPAASRPLRRGTSPG